MNILKRLRTERYVQRKTARRQGLLVGCVSLAFAGGLWAFTRPVIAALPTLESDCGISLSSSVRGDLPDKLLELLQAEPQRFPCYMESLHPLFNAEINANLQWNLLQSLVGKPFLRPSQRKILEMLAVLPQEAGAQGVQGQIQRQAMMALLPEMSAQTRWNWFAQHHKKLDRRMRSDFMLYQGEHLSAQDAQTFAQHFQSDVEQALEAIHDARSIKHLCALLQYTDSPKHQEKLLSLMESSRKYEFVMGALLLQKYASEVVQQQVFIQIAQRLVTEEDPEWIGSELRALDTLAVGDLSESLLRTLRTHQVPEVQLMAMHRYILQEQPTYPSRLLGQLLRPEVMARSASPVELAESILRRLYALQPVNGGLSAPQLTELQNQAFRPEVKKVVDKYLDEMRDSLR